MKRILKNIAFIVAIASAMTLTSCGNGSKSDTAVDTTTQATEQAYQNVPFDSVACVSLSDINGCDMTVEQFTTMVDQANTLIDEANERFTQIMAKNTTDEAKAEFKAFIRSFRFQCAQRFKDEMPVDMDAMDVPADVQERAKRAMENGDRMQKTFEQMFYSMSGIEGDAANPQFDNLRIES